MLTGAGSEGLRLFRTLSTHHESWQGVLPCLCDPSLRRAPPSRRPVTHVAILAACRTAIDASTYGVCVTRQMAVRRRTVEEASAIEVMPFATPCVVFASWDVHPGRD